MDEIAEVLKRLDERMGRIEAALQAQPPATKVNRQWYNPKEVEVLSLSRDAEFRTVGTGTGYTVRLACNDGRIPDAVKQANGKWAIPGDVVERILAEGLPPERRGSKHRLST